MSKALGQRIRQFRLDQEMTIRDVATVLGVSTGTIVRLLRGEKCHELTKVKIERKLDKVQPQAIVAA